MNVSAPFIARPIATILLAIGLLIAGAVAYRFLPVSPLPSVDIPTIVVMASRPGADPETMANSIAAPLERRLGEISGVTELTSTSSTGSTAIVIQFDYSRDIDGAAHDVQAAINAATTDLPSDLPTRPYYRKINPADAPILTLALTSDTLSTAQIYDAADTILAQRLSQAQGVSQVVVNGAEKPAVRVQLDPVRLAAAGLAGQDVYNAIRAANVLEPTGGFQGRDAAEMIAINGQMSQADEYNALVLKAGNGAVVRLSDVATVVNGVASSRLAAWNGKQPAILLNVTKQAGANVIDTVERVKALLPQLLSWMPPDIRLTVIADRTTTIRASVDDIQYTLLLTIALVLLVVLVFMRRLMPTIAAAATVPLSICGTLAGMWFLGYSLDNFSLMALTISVGFVVDDAIVMIENISRHMERGMTPLAAALAGSRQIGFTVVSISLSLVAVFTPLLFMGGILGKLFHEFAVTVTIAIAVSAVVSLTLTPMICGRFMSHDAAKPPSTGGLWGRIDRAVEWSFACMQRFYARTLGWALRHRVFMLLLMLATVVLTIRLYGAVPKGFLPEQDTGLLIGQTIASPDVSFRAMTDRQRAAVDVLLADPAVASVGSTIGVASGWNSLNRGTLYVSLKPLAERRASANAVIERLRAPLARVGGVETSLYLAQDLRGGGRTGGAAYQFSVVSQNLDEMRLWTERLVDKLRSVPGVADVSSDQDRAGPQMDVVIDRVAAARLGVTAAAIDNGLNNAYSQRQISTIYTQRNQYKVGTGGRSQAADRPVVARPHLYRCHGWWAGAAVGRGAFHPGYRAAGGASRGAVPCRDDQLQRDQRHVARPGHCGDPASGARPVDAGQRAGRVRRQCAFPYAVAVVAADADRGGADLHLHRARRAVRELAAPAHHPQHVAVGRGRRAVGAAGDGNRPVHHGDHWHHPVDGHREKERHHAGGFRAGAGARAWVVAVRGHFRRLHGALPPHHDDDPRGPARRAAARLRVRHRRRAAPPARHLDRRRADPVAGADAVYDAGGLSRTGAAEPGQAAAPQRTGAGGVDPPLRNPARLPRATPGEARLHRHRLAPRTVSRAPCANDSV